MLKTAKLSIFFGLLLASLVFVQGTFAQAVLPGNTNRNVKEANPVAAENMSDKAMVAQNKTGTDAAMMRKNNLTEARLRICQSREERISNRFTNVLSLGARVQQNFEGFIARVDYFYVNTLSPQGYTLENYSELKADTATKQAAVNAALAEVRAGGQDFSCDSEDPKAQADTFRTNSQALITANKEYRTSVRTFVAAVRDLAKEMRTATLSVTPEVSPVATGGAVAQ